MCMDDDIEVCYSVGVTAEVCNSRYNGWRRGSSSSCLLHLLKSSVRWRQSIMGTRVDSQRVFEKEPFTDERI